MDYWIIGLLDCWIVGLLERVALGLALLLLKAVLDVPLRNWLIILFHKKTDRAPRGKSNDPMIQQFHNPNVQNPTNSAPGGDGYPFSFLEKDRRRRRK